MVAFVATEPTFWVLATNLTSGYRAIGWIASASPTDFRLISTNGEIVRWPQHGLGAIGTRLWLGTAGGYVAAEPTDPSVVNVQEVAQVLDANTLIVRFPNEKDLNEGAPADATYVVATSTLTLSSELVLEDSVIMEGTLAARPASSVVAGALYFVTDAGSTRCTRSNGIAWVDEVPDWSQIPNKPSTFTPSAHAASHKHGGADEVATATPGANLIPKAGAGGTFATGWIPTLNQNTTGTAGGLSATNDVGHGGTGATTLAAHGVVVGNGASAVNVTGAGTAGQVLVSGGASADPAYATTVIVDELNGRVGIGGTPGQALDVTKTVNAALASRVVNGSSGVSAESRLQVAANVGRIEVIALSSGYTAFGYFGLGTPASWTFVAAAAGSGLGLGTIHSAPVLFASNNIERARLEADGRFRLNQDLRLTTTFNSSSGTTPALVTGLSFTLVAGATYVFEAVLRYNADATGGHKYSMAGTATATAIDLYVFSVTDGTGASNIAAAQTTIGGASGQAGSTAGLTRITGTIVCNAGGTFGPAFSRNAATGTSSILSGSSFFCRPA